MVVGKSLILAIIITSLAGCGITHKREYYDSASTRLPAVSGYHDTSTVYAALLNFSKYKYYGLTEEDRQKQQESVFFALNNLDNGQVVSWHNETNSTFGQVKAVASFPQGSGYCRIIFTQISKENKIRDFRETACRESGFDGWRFVQK